MKMFDCTELSRSVRAYTRGALYSCPLFPWLIHK